MLEWSLNAQTITVAPSSEAVDASRGNYAGLLNALDQTEEFSSDSDYEELPEDFQREAFNGVRFLTP